LSGRGYANQDERIIRSGSFVKQRIKTSFPVLAACAAGIYYLATNIFYWIDTLYFQPAFPYIINFVDISPTDYFVNFLTVQGYYPPFYYIVMGLIWLALGIHHIPFYLSTPLFVLAGAGYLFAYLRKVSDDTAAAFGVALMLFLPGTAVFSTRLTIEAPLMLFLPAIIYHLHASRGFSRPYHALAAGIFSGLAFMTKWTFPVYVGFFYAWFVLDALIDWKKFGLKSLRPVHAKSALSFLASLLIIGAPWYLFVFDPELFKSTVSNDPVMSEYNYFKQFSLSIHLMSLISGQIFGPVLLCVLAVLLAFSKKATWLVAAALLVIAAPLAVFAIPVHQEERYLFPMAPAVAIVVAVALGNLRWKWLKPLAVIILLPLLLYSHWAVYSPTDKYTRPERDESLFWGSAETKTVLEILYQQHQELGLDRALKFARHPFWVNYHSEENYLIYFTYLNPEWRHRLLVARYTRFLYKEFAESIKDLDILLIDPVQLEWHLNADEKALFDHSIPYLDGYIDQMQGSQHEGFDLIEVNQDWQRLIVPNFRLLRSLEFNDGFKVDIYLRKTLEESVTTKIPAVS
jgi:4-amino-4-deoxy-L-arabinose transferase-like glycosyltransferase